MDEAEELKRQTYALLATLAFAAIFALAFQIGGPRLPILAAPDLYRPPVPLALHALRDEEVDEAARGVGEAGYHTGIWGRCCAPGGVSRRGVGSRVRSYQVLREQAGESARVGGRRPGQGAGDLSGSSTRTTLSAWTTRTGVRSRGMDNTRGETKRGVLFAVQTKSTVLMSWILQKPSPDQ